VKLLLGWIQVMKVKRTLVPVVPAEDAAPSGLCNELRFGAAPPLGDRVHSTLSATSATAVFDHEGGPPMLGALLQQSSLTIRDRALDLGATHVRGFGRP
jgi:hypothetical protein